MGQLVLEFQASYKSFQFQCQLELNKRCGDATLYWYGIGDWLPPHSILASALAKLSASHDVLFSLNQDCLTPEPDQLILILR